MRLVVVLEDTNAIDPPERAKQRAEATEDA